MKNEKEKKKVQSKHGETVLLERMDKKIDHVLEGHAVLDKKIESFNSNLNKKIDDFRFEMKTEFKALSTKVEGMEDKYDKNFAVVLKYLSRIDDEVQYLKRMLFNKADLDRVIALEKRVTEIQLIVEKHYGKNSN